MRYQNITQNRSSKTNHVITEPKALTPEFLTSILHRNGVAHNTKVSTVRIVLQKELSISTVCRLGISYERPADESCPRSLFLKLPRVLGEDVNISVADDHAEVGFYRDVGPVAACPPLVRCYDAAYSEGSSHILLDDLTESHEQPDEEQAPSEEMSRLAIKALGRAHRSWWHSRADLSAANEDVSMKNIPGWSRRFHDERNRFDDKWLLKFSANLEVSVARFTEAARLTAKQKDVYRRMVKNADRIWGRLTRIDHVTVTHGDTHWWNFLYPKDTRTHSVHLIDWHLWHIDLGARDLAFLLALGGFAEPRPELEENLLRLYHETLGIPDYSWEMLIEDYRWSTIRNLNIPVIFWSQGKPYTEWQTALRRAWGAYDRLKCADLL
jgi:thiamine kinase-like enzyme